MENLIKKLNGKTWEKGQIKRVYLNAEEFEGAKVFLENGNLVIQNPYDREFQTTLFNLFDVSEIVEFLSDILGKNLNLNYDADLSNAYKAVFKI